MKLYVSLTSIPPRLDQAIQIAERNTGQLCDGVFLNIPKRYNRFPSWQGEVHSANPKVIINRDCKDLGPCTKVFGPIERLEPEDLIVYIDDDIQYNLALVENLLACHILDPQSAWRLAGFNFSDYFRFSYPKIYDTPVDVIEGFGGVLVKVEWLKKIYQEFLELTHDDVALSLLLQKIGIQRKMAFSPECNFIQLYSYDQTGGALYKNYPGGNQEKYKEALLSLEKKGKNYSSFSCMWLPFFPKQPMNPQIWSKKSNEEVFTHIYDTAAWDRESDMKGTSGSGSSPERAKEYIEFLRDFLKTNSIQSVVDLGCGDWQISRLIDWNGIDYLGVDVVTSIIKKNTEQFSASNIHFLQADGIEEPLPHAELLICKDVLQHLPYKDIFSIIPQFQKFKYCLITNDDDLNANKDILRGSYRPLDITKPPFNLMGEKIFTYVSGDKIKQVILLN